MSAGRGEGMKGLVIKDLFCLKKRLVILCFVIVGVLALSVMFVLSARFGNVAQAGKDMLKDNDITAIDVENLAVTALAFFMLVPIAAVGDMAMVCDMDEKAGFCKVSASLPVSLKKRVLARYFTVIALYFLSALIDMVIAFVLSRISDIITFGVFLNIIFSCVSIMLLYSVCVIFYCFVLDSGKTSYAQLFSFLTLIAAAVLANLKTVKQIIRGMSAGSQDISFIWNVFDFIKEKSWILLIIALGGCIISYTASMLVVNRKRGVI